MEAAVNAILVFNRLSIHQRPQQSFWMLRMRWADRAAWVTLRPMRDFSYTLWAIFHSA